MATKSIHFTSRSSNTEINKFISLCCEQEVFPGVEILVQVGNEKVFHNSWGQTEISHTSTPLKNNTLFDIASITKVFTATAIMILQEKGLLDLTENISSYFPRV